MNNRSVQAEEIRQSVVVTGDGNSVWLRFGETRVILPLIRKQFRPSERRRRITPDTRRRELDILGPKLANSLSLAGWICSQSLKRGLMMTLTFLSTLSSAGREPARPALLLNSAP